MENLQALFSFINIDADWISMRYVEESSTFRKAHLGILDPLEMTEDRGIMIEILVEGHFAYAGTNDLSKQGIQSAAQRALNQVNLCKKYSLNSFDITVRPSFNGIYKTPSISPCQSAFLNDLALKISRDLKISDDIIHTNVLYISVDRKVHYISSSGAYLKQEFQQRACQISATAQHGSVIQTRTNGLPVAQAGDEFIIEKSYQEIVKKVAQEAIELSKAPDCPEGIYDLILLPDQLYLQIHESIGHPLELDRILGDERNYAGWSFVNLEDFGRLQYGSPLLNVKFDPHVPHELASYYYDDTGAIAEPHYIIEKGILKRGLGSLESQMRSKVPGVASSRATSWNRPPIDRMANLNIEAGNSSLQDMIGGTERGIIMQTNKSWSIDDYRRKFQFGCEYAQLIENGRLTQVVKNPNYRGTTTPFWHSLKKVGDASTFELFGSFYCGKGEPNQIIRVGHATPACLFSNIEIFGGGA